MIQHLYKVKNASNAQASNHCRANAIIPKEWDHVPHFHHHDTKTPQIKSSQSIENNCQCMIDNPRNRYVA